MSNNVWNSALGRWVDVDTGNQLINGVWTNTQGGTYQNGAWTAPGAANGQQSNAQAGSPGFSTNGYSTLPGYQWIVDQLNRQHEDATLQAQQRFTTQQTQLQEGFQSHMADVDAALQRELQSGRIASDQYMQTRTLAQQESEFARDLALKSLTADRDYAIQRASEMRAERLQQAQLEANPTDFVASQFYKRNLGAPGAWDLAQQFSNGGTASPAPNANVTTTVQKDANGNPVNADGTPVIDPNNLTDINGNPYPKMAPAYDDATLQKLVASFYGGGTNGGGTATGAGTAPTGPSLYNPLLGGKGDFGVTIGNPGQLGRAQAGQLGNEGMGLLTSFLKGGINVNGKQVAIDPTDYFQQAQNGWVPTLTGGGTGATSYS